MLKMLGTRASSYASENATTKGSNDKHKNAQKQPDTHRGLRRRRSHQGAAGDMEQLSSRSRSIRSIHSNARTYLVSDNQSLSSQPNHERQASEVLREQLWNANLQTTSNTNKTPGSGRSKTSRFDLALNRDSDASKQQKHSGLQAAEHRLRAVEETEEDEEQESSKGYRSWADNQASYVTEDESSELGSDIDAGDAQYKTAIQEADHLQMKHQNRLQIQPSRSSGWILADADPLKTMDHNFQNYRRNSYQARGPLVRSANTLNIDSQAPQPINRFLDHLERNRDREYNDSGVVRRPDDVPSSSSTQVEHRSLPFGSNSAWPAHGLNLTEDEDKDEVVFSKSSQQSTQKQFSKAFVKHMKDGTRFWYKKPVSFWLSVGLSGWILCSHFLCSAGNICEQFGRVNILATYLLQSPLDAMCSFGVIQLLCFGILDIIGGLINVFANIGVYTAHQASATNEDNGWHPFTRLKLRSSSTPWVGTLIDLLENILEPLVMLISTFAFPFLLDDRHWEQYFSASRSYGFRGCSVNLWLHIAKWVVQALEDCFNIQQPHTYSRRHLQRPLTTAMFIVLLLLALYPYRELLLFDMMQTWGHAIAYGQNEGYRLGDKRVVRKITTDSGYWTMAVGRIVYKVTTTLVTGIVVPGAL